MPVRVAKDISGQSRDSKIPLYSSKSIYSDSLDSLKDSLTHLQWVYMPVQVQQDSSRQSQEQLDTSISLQLHPFQLYRQSQGQPNPSPMGLYASSSTARLI